MSVSFGGIGSVIATFRTYGTIPEGGPVKMHGDGAVQACAAGDRFCGIAVYVSDDGHAAVQLGGCASAAYTGTAPAVGYGRLVADGAGAVKTDSGTTGGEYLTLGTDTAAKTCGFIL